MKLERAINVDDVLSFNSQYASLNISTSALWVLTGVGSGAAVMSPAYIYGTTGATTGSTINNRIVLFGMNHGGTMHHVNFAKRILFKCDIRVGGNAAGVTKYLQIKTANTIGDLGALGIGVKVDNDKIYGESYGTERGAVELATIGTTEYALLIDHNPQRGSIDWYLNGALVGTQSDPNKIPNASTGATTYVLMSADNGATVTTATIYITPPNILVKL